MANCVRCGRELPSSSSWQGANGLCSDCRTAMAGMVTAAAPSAPRIAASRRFPPVTTALVGINVAVFLAMALSAASFSQPTTTQLLKWGANWGPRSLGAQPWRMLTSNYVHIGLLHILFNMWCLWDLGNLAERIFDGATYLLIYTACGIAGSLASLWWHPLVIGAGASGAIFGLAGALITGLYLGRLPIPKQAVRHTLRSLVIFAGYNLFFGAVGAGIDNSAHMGGLITGLALGAIMAKHLTSPAEVRGRWRLGVFAATAVILLTAFSSVKRANAYVVPLERGVNELQNNRSDAAVRDLEQAASEKPGEATVLGLLGDAYVEKGEYAKAESVLQRAVQINPDSADMQYSLGFAKLKLGKVDQAIPALQKAAQLDPKDPDPQEALARAYRAKNMPAEAQAAMQRARDLRKTAPQ
jgi:membrane associated rhomboid family serine protease/Flp pilus assembly protein TadD